MHKSEDSKKRRVLIADDSELVRNSLARLICSLPNLELVAEAGDGFEACEAVRSINPDLAILDINMPEMNGIQVLNEIRSGGFLGTVIMLAGDVSDEHRRACRTKGAKHVFEKCSQGPQLIEACVLFEMRERAGFHSR